MKTVSGKVVSTKSISLSKAAKVLSTFAEAETGASQAVSAYVKRASASFNELIQFHKERKPSVSDRKDKKNLLENSNSEKLEGSKISRDVEDSVRSESVRKREKKKKKNSSEGGVNVGIEEGQGKQRKSENIDDGEVVDLAGQSSSKSKKKRRKIEGEH